MSETGVTVTEHSSWASAHRASAIDAMDDMITAALDQGVAAGAAETVRIVYTMVAWAALFHAAAWHTWDETRRGSDRHLILWKSHEATAECLAATLEAT